MIILFENQEEGSLGLNDYSFMPGKVTFDEFVELYRKANRKDGHIPLSEIMLLLAEALQYSRIQATSIGGLKAYKGGKTYSIRGLMFYSQCLNRGDKLP